MMNDNNNYQARTTVAPPFGGVDFFSETHTLEFPIRGFMDLPDKRLDSPTMPCHGFHWYLTIYPHGDEEAKEKAAKYQGIPSISVYVRCVETETGKVKSVSVRYSFRIGRFATKVVKTALIEEKQPWGCKGSWNRTNMEARRACNDDGTLVIKLDLQIDVRAKTLWKPLPDARGLLNKLYESQTGSDITFAVDDTYIKAHKCILAMHGSHLVALADGLSQETEIPIDGTDPDLFEAMIRFHYTEILPSDIDGSRAIDLLKMADKFGVIKLKMLLEAYIVESTALLADDSCLDVLLLSDSYNCALLGGAAMNMVVDNMPQIMGSEGWQHVLKSLDLVQEIMLCQANRVRGMDTANNIHALDAMSVSALRQRASKQGLEVDGSRDVLVKRLKTAEDNNDN